MATRAEILEALPWPAATSGQSAGGLMGMLYPLNPRGMTTFVASAMRTRLQTACASGNLRLSIYSYSYTAQGVWSASFIGQTQGSTATNTAFVYPSFASPITLDFTNNRYMVGICLPDATGRVWSANYGVNQFGAINITTAMTSVSTWPTTLDQTLTTPIAYLPYIGLLTGQAKLYI